MHSRVETYSQAGIPSATEKFREAIEILAQARPESWKNRNLRLIAFSLDDIKGTIGPHKLDGQKTIYYDYHDYGDTHDPSPVIIYQKPVDLKELATAMIHAHATKKDTPINIYCHVSQLLVVQELFSHADVQMFDHPDLNDSKFIRVREMSIAFCADVKHGEVKPEQIHILALQE